MRSGYAVSINEIDRIDREGFEEHEVARIEPLWDKDVLAAHTFNFVPGLTVVDALVRRPWNNSAPWGTSGSR